MRSENGIPRPERARDLRADVDDLFRIVRGLASRRTFVSAGNIVAGGTITPEAATQITETVQKDIQLTAGQVAIGEAGNLERDPNFEKLDGWTPYNLSDPTLRRHVGEGYNGANAISFPATDEEEELSGAWRYSPDGRYSFPVEAGKNYHVSCWVQPQNADLPPQGVALYLRASTPDEGFWGVEVEESAQNAVTIPAGEWARITGVVTMPENATSAFLGYFRFANSHGTVVRYSTPTVQASISNDLLDVEFFRGLRIVGASIETNDEPETGVKMDDDGLTAHGQAEVTRGGEVDLYKVRAVVDNRVNQWGDGDGETLPGFWLESEPADGSGTPPLFAAGLTLTETDAKGIRMRSAMETPESPYSEVVASPEGVSLNSYGQLPPGSSSRPDLSVIGVYEDSFNIGTSDGGTGYDAQVQHRGDGILRLNGVNGVLLGGRSQKYIPSTQATVKNGFTHFMEGGWAGVRYSRSGDVVEVTGAWNKTGYGHQEVVCVLPQEIWPKAKKAGLNGEVNTAGELLTVWNQIGYGNGPVAFSLTYLI